jgi:hypothetical protein
LHAFLVSPMLHARPSPWFDHPKRKACKLRSSTLCSLLQSLATSSLLGPNVLLSSLWQTKFHTHTKQQVKLWFFIYILIFMFSESRWVPCSLLSVCCYVL